MIKLNKILELNTPKGDAGIGLMDDMVDAPMGDVGVHFLKNKEYIIKNGWRIYDFKLHGHINILVTFKNWHYVVGGIKLEEWDAKEMNVDTTDVVYIVDFSVVDEKFRNKGIAKIMYEYVIKKYKVVMSDNTLYPGSYHIWTEYIPQNIPGTMCVVLNEHDEYNWMIYNNQKKSSIEGFLFFYKDEFLPKKIKEEKTFISSTYRKNYMYTEVRVDKKSFINHIKNNTYKKLYDFIDYMDTREGYLICIGKDFRAILKFTDGLNDKPKLNIIKIY